MSPLEFGAVFFPAMFHLAWAYQCRLCGVGTVCDGRGCSCRSGFDGKRWIPASRSYVCKDINECVGKGHRCKTGTRCVNREGSYDCKCRRGWYGPWVTAQGEFVCTERSLCESVYHRCGAGTHCQDTNTTSYRCVCSVGFTSRTISKVDEIYTCSDIDECVERRARGPACGQNSLCTNTPGSFTCKCRPGFQSAWKDNINCDQKVTPQKSVVTESVDFYKIGLAAGIGVLVLVIAVIGLCCVLRRHRSARKSSIKRRYHDNGQPIKISVLTGRESSYVNVILTSHDDQETPANATQSDKDEESNKNQHIYSNELLELEVNLLKHGQTSREVEELSEAESGYVNHNSIRKAKRCYSQQEPARCKINIRRPFSDSSVRVSGISEELQQRLSLRKKISESDSEGRIPTLRGVYDRFQRGSTASPQSSVGKPTDHIYASPDDSSEEDPSDSGSVFDIYQPVAQEMGGTSAVTDTESSMIYEPVLYSLPNKPAKQERIYANQNTQ